MNQFEKNNKNLIIPEPGKFDKEEEKELLDKKENAIKEVIKIWQQSLDRPFEEISKEDFLSMFAPLQQEILSKHPEDLKKIYAAQVLEQAGLLDFVMGLKLESVNDNTEEQRMLHMIRDYAASYKQLKEGDESLKTNYSEETVE